MNIDLLTARRNVKNKKNNMKFPFVVALLYQLYFLLAYTVFRDICIVPRNFFRPSISGEYLEWFANEYESVFDGEAHFVIIGVVINYMVCGICVGEILSLLLTKEYEEDRTCIGKKHMLGILLCGGVICVGYVFFNSMRGLPYQFYRDAVIPEILSIMTIVFYGMSQKA